MTELQGWLLIGLLVFMVFQIGSIGSSLDEVKAHLND